MNNLQNYIRERFLLLKNAYKREGLAYVVKEGIKYITRPLYNSLVYGPTNKFTYQGKSFRYFVHKYNETWLNERKVEIPIIFSIVKENKDKRILEIGNVLRHYFPLKHDVVDLYEKYIGVINQDIVEFKPAQKYDLVISISTFEHIGNNENEPYDPGAFSRAIQNVIDNVLSESGQLILTLPLGQNLGMEDMLIRKIIKFKDLSCMQQISGTPHKWQEISWVEVASKEFNSAAKWIGVNRTVLVGTIYKPHDTR